MSAVERAPDPSLGLRERKKQRTRETIVRVAMDLFAEHGFERTTIHDIAAGAEIAPRTFFGYFASKEAVVFHDFDAAFVDFSDRLETRPPGVTAFDAMRAWLLDWLDEREGTLEEADAARRRLIRDTPALAAHERGNLARFEVVLARAVADDLGVPDDSLRPHLVAAAAVAALDALGRHGEDAPKPAGERAQAVLDEALAFLQGGLDALRRRAPVDEP
jgi:AcrR family transcriptional regulator